MSTDQQSTAAVPQKVRLESWGWTKAFIAVLAICVFAWGLGMGLRSWAAADWQISTIRIVFITSGAAAAICFVLLSWKAVAEFFLSIRVGVAVLVLFCIGSILSVLIPPREPGKYAFDGSGRPRNFEQQEAMYKDDFAWATGYFFYHLLHPYGFGLPNAKLPFEDGGPDPDSPLEPTTRPAKANPLERISVRYGERLARQEESGMRTALSGRARGMEIQSFIQRNKNFFDGFYEVSKKMQLSGTDTAKGAWASDWFAALTTLLFIVVITNTFRRGIARSIAQGAPGLGFLAKLPSALWWDLKSLVRIDRIGFLVTHLGVLVTIGGGFWSRLTEERGVVQLSIRPKVDMLPQESAQFRSYTNETKYFGTPSKPFAVRLAEFRADYRDTIEVNFLEDPPSRVVPRYSYFELWKGRQIGFEYNEKGSGDPKTIVRVLEHYPRVNVDFDLAERADGEIAASMAEMRGPALKVKFEFANDSQEGYLVAGDEFMSVFDKTPGVRIRYESAPNAREQASRLEMPFEGEAFGVVHVLLASNPGKPAVSVPISVGSSFTFRTPKGDAKVKILRALPDARLMPSPSGEKAPKYENVPLELVPPLHAGVALEITDSGGTRVSTAWFYENEGDSMENDRGIVDIDGTRARFAIEWDHWRSPAKERYRMVSAPGEPLKIVKIGTREIQEVKIGEVFRTSAGLSFLVGRRADRPKLVPIIQPIPGDADGGDLYFNTSPPAARIQVDGPQGKQEFMIAATPFADTAIYANRIAVRIFENDMEMPKEWKSKLEFMEPTADSKWKIVNTQTIRVNDYAYYRGFRLFQTDANKQFPGYSGVGVVFDPGIETVIWGMWAIIAGVAYVFLIKPFFRKSVQS